MTGTLPLGNEVDGIIFSTSASNNTVGGHGGGQGNTIAFNVGGRRPRPVGDRRLDPVEQHLFQRAAGHRPDRDRPIMLRLPRSLTERAGGGTGSNIEGSLTSVAEHHVLDPVLQQPGRRSVRFWPGPDVSRLDDGHRPTPAALRPSTSICRAGWPSETWLTATGDQREHRRYIGILQRHLGAGGQRRVLDGQLTRSLRRPGRPRSTSSGREI